MAPFELSGTGLGKGAPDVAIIAKRRRRMAGTFAGCRQIITDEYYWQNKLTAAGGSSNLAADSKLAWRALRPTTGEQPGSNVAKDREAL